ncbi:class I adenylate-forming enzyme family protein [Dactylosporangium sp. NPDC051485]|uniref:class I adenylate-forming enzyme family protein n=1 Tax=Dactylosporangium sp. NPDC051485 TaxID=3154846 RepID=UPI003426AAF3
MLDQIAERFADLALICEPGQPPITAAGLRAAAQAAAGGLREQGVRRNALIVVECADLSLGEFARLYLGAVWAGAVPVLVPERDFEPAAALGPELVVGRDGGLVDGGPLERSEFADDDVLDVVFTSGTTGSWKPVLSTHRQWADALPLPRRGARPAVVGQGGVPWSASAGVHGVFLHHLARAVTSVWAPTPEGLIAESARRGAVELHLTPHSLTALLQHRDVVPVEWARQVRTIKTVGGSVPTRIAQTTVDTFPAARLACLYGLTESGSALTLKVFDPRTPNSIGRPLPGTEVRIVDELGGPVPDGAEGDIQIRRSDLPAMSYFPPARVPERTFLDDGWVDTGDRGFVHASGEIHLVGRSKELLFLQSGRRAPQAIEDHYHGLVPNAGELAVVGIPSPGMWDEIALFVVGDPVDRQIARLTAELRTPDCAYPPDHVLSVAAIPRTKMGKVRRGELYRTFRETESSHAGEPS